MPAGRVAMRFSVDSIDVVPVAGLTKSSDITIGKTRLLILDMAPFYELRIKQKKRLPGRYRKSFRKPASRLSSHEYRTVVIPGCRLPDTGVKTDSKALMCSGICVCWDNRTFLHAG